MQIVSDVMRAVGRFLISWYVAGPALAILGLAIGYAVFFNVFPGRPKIGVIDIPYSALGEDAASIITAYLEYCRRDPEIKAVVVKLASPGGGASPSEQLYIETRALREKKPVVLMMNSVVASGGYMMALGTSYTYTKTSTLVGNVGVVAGAGPVLAPRFYENVSYTGPYKLLGISRRDWITTLDRLNEAFIEMTVRERGDRLKLSRSELADGRLYAGMDAVRLGLADEIGSDAQAYDKAAELAGIANYELVNVNVEVNRLFVQNLRRIYSSSGDANAPLTEADAWLMDLFASRQLPQAPPPAILTGELESDDPAGQEAVPAWSGETPARPFDLDALKLPLEHGVLGVPPEEVFPEFPVEMSRPQFYYLYVGAAP